MSIVWNKIKTSYVFRSLRVRIFLILMLVGVIPGIASHLGIMERYTHNAMEVRSKEVQTQIKILLLVFLSLYHSSPKQLSLRLEQ